MENENCKENATNEGEFLRYNARSNKLTFAFTKKQPLGVALKSMLLILAHLLEEKEHYKNAISNSKDI